MTDDFYYVALQQVFPTGYPKLQEALTHFHSAEAIVKADADTLRQSGCFSEQQAQKIKRIDIDRAKQLWQDTIDAGAQIITPASADYPEKLLHIYAPPLVLYVLGNLRQLNDALTIAVVGTRNMTEYGKAATEQICYPLAKAGAVIISGLAVGIDTAAHRAAVLAEGRTIGLLGCGLDINYPAGSAELKRQILRNNGAIATEYPLGTRPYGSNFPIRNRLIAGLAVGVLVVEGLRTSGALITAKQALEQGKDVFAVPGNILQATSEAPNSLIKDGAIPVMRAADILGEYHIVYSEEPQMPPVQPDPPTEEPVVRQSRRLGAKQKQQPVFNETEMPVSMPKALHESTKPLPAHLTKEQLLVYNLIDTTPKGMEQILLECNLSTGQILSILTELEMEGLIRSYPGRKFSLIGD